MSKQFQELSDTVTDTMENLEQISVFGRSGNTLENIMVYKTRIGLELSHLQGSELDIMAYCHEEWKYFTKTYPNVEAEILPSIKALLRYDECINFFSEENIQKRRIEKELLDLQTLCRTQTNGFIFSAGVALMFAHFVFCIFLIVTPYTFIGIVHSLLFLLWLMLVFVGSEIDKIDSNKLFKQRKAELGYVELD
jgi:hypothetical protein